MLNPKAKWIIPSSSSLMFPPLLALSANYTNPSPKLKLSTISIDRAYLGLRNDGRNEVGMEGKYCCGARRRVRYEEEEEEEEGNDGYNEEIAMLELYTQSKQGEVLIVHAILDEEEVEVLIFKGFSSSLSHETSSDASRSVIPARAVIKSIDRIKGPFDPSNIEYLEKDIEWNSFKTRLDNSIRKF